MPNGYGRGFGRGGWGLGFRGSSPPWPYVGRGRGGLPRCGYFFSGAAGIPVPPLYSTYGAPSTVAQAYPYGYQMSREERTGVPERPGGGDKGRVRADRCQNERAGCRVS